MGIRIVLPSQGHCHDEMKCHTQSEHYTGVTDPCRRNKLHANRSISASSRPTWGCGRAAGVSTSKVPGLAELAGGLPWHSPALKKALEKCLDSPRCQCVDWDTLASVKVFFHGLLTCPALATGLGPADWSVVHLFHGKRRVRQYRTHSTVAVVMSVCLGGSAPSSLWALPCSD